MESNDLAEQLHAAERGAAAPHVDYPPTPWWYAPLVGAWTAAVIGTFTWWRENAILFTGCLVVLVTAEIAFIGWMQRRHGAMPRPGHGTPPPEIARMWRAYLSALPLIAVAVALSWWLGGVPVAAATAFLLVTAGLIRYERAYAAAAADVRARLR